MPMRCCHDGVRAPVVRTAVDNIFFVNAGAFQNVRVEAVKVDESE
jgi:hypothetical protein